MGLLKILILIDYLKKSQRKILQNMLNLCHCKPTKQLMNQNVWILNNNF